MKLHLPVKLRASVLAAIVAVPALLYNQAFAAQTASSVADLLPVVDGAYTSGENLTISGVVNASGSGLSEIQVTAGGSEAGDLAIQSTGALMNVETVTVANDMTVAGSVSNVSDINVAGTATLQNTAQLDNVSLTAVTISGADAVTSLTDSILTQTRGNWSLSSVKAGNTYINKGGKITVTGAITEAGATLQTDSNNINLNGAINAGVTIDSGNRIQVSGTTIAVGQIWSAASDIRFNAANNPSITVSDSQLSAGGALYGGAKLTLQNCSGLEGTETVSVGSVNLHSLILDNTDLTSTGSVLVFGDNNGPAKLSVKNGSVADFASIARSNSSGRTVDVLVDGAGSVLSIRQSSTIAGTVTVQDGATLQAAGGLTLDGAIKDDGKIIGSTLTTTGDSITSDGLGADESGNTLTAATGITVRGAIEGTGNTLKTTGTAAGIELQGNVDAAVTVSAAGELTLTNGVSSVASGQNWTADSLAIQAVNAVTLDNSTVSITEAVTSQNDLTISAGTSLTAEGVDVGDNTLTLSGSSTTVATSDNSKVELTADTVALENGMALANAVVNASTFTQEEGTSYSGVTFAMSGAQDFGDVTTDDNTYSSDGTLSFGTISGDDNSATSSVANADAIVVGGEISGNNTQLTATGDGGAISVNSIGGTGTAISTTSGDITVNGAITGADTSISTTGGKITVNGAITAASAIETTNGGDVELHADVTASAITSSGDLNIIRDGGVTISDSDLGVTGAITGNALTLTGSKTPDREHTAGSVDNDALTVSTDTSLNVANTVNTGALAVAGTLEAGGDVTGAGGSDISGALSSTAGNISLTEATVSGDVSTIAGDISLTGGTVTGGTLSAGRGTDGGDLILDNESVSGADLTIANDLQMTNSSSITNVTDVTAGNSISVGNSTISGVTTGGVVAQAGSISVTNGSITGITRDVTATTGAITVDNGSIANVTGDVEAQGGKLSVQNGGTIATVGGSVTSADAIEVTGAGSSIATVGGSVTSADAIEVTGAGSSIATVGGDVTAQTDISVTNGSITGITGDVTATTGSITVDGGSISQVGDADTPTISDVSAAGNITLTNSGTISDVTGDVAAQGELSVRNGGSVATVGGSVTSLDAIEVTGADSSITNVTGDVVTGTDKDMTITGGGSVSAVAGTVSVGKDLIIGQDTAAKDGSSLSDVGTLAVAGDMTVTGGDVSSVAGGTVGGTLTLQDSSTMKSTQLTVTGDITVDATSDIGGAEADAVELTSTEGNIAVDHIGSDAAGSDGNVLTSEKGYVAITQGITGSKNVLTAAQNITTGAVIAGNENQLSAGGDIELGATDGTSIEGNNNVVIAQGNVTLQGSMGENNTVKAYTGGINVQTDISGTDGVYKAGGQVVVQGSVTGSGHTLLSYGKGVGLDDVAVSIGGFSAQGSTVGIATENDEDPGYGTPINQGSVSIGAMTGPADVDATLMNSIYAAGNVEIGSLTGFSAYTTIEAGKTIGVGAESSASNQTWQASDLSIGTGGLTLTNSTLNIANSISGSSLTLTADSGTPAADSMTRYSSVVSSVNLTNLSLSGTFVKADADAGTVGQDDSVSLTVTGNLTVTGELTITNNALLKVDGTATIGSLTLDGEWATLLGSDVTVDSLKLQNGATYDSTKLSASELTLSGPSTMNLTDLELKGVMSLTAENSLILTVTGDRGLVNLSGDVTAQNNSQIQVTDDLETSASIASNGGADGASLISASSISAGETITAEGGNITSTIGGITAGTGVSATGGTISSAGAITATTGDVTASTGGSITAAGDISASDGSVSANGGTITTQGAISATAGTVTGSGAVSATEGGSISSGSIMADTGVSATGGSTISSAGAITATTGDVATGEGGSITAEGAISAIAGSVSATGGSIAATTGDVTAAGAVSATQGGSISGGSITAGGSLTANGGSISSTTGGITAGTGVNATNGTISWGGASTTVSGDVTAGTDGTITAEGAISATTGSVTANGGSISGGSVTSSGSMSVSDGGTIAATSGSVTAQNGISGTDGSIAAASDIAVTGSVTNTGTDTGLELTAGGAITVSAGVSGGQVAMQADSISITGDLGDNSNDLDSQTDISITGSIAGDSNTLDTVTGDITAAAVAGTGNTLTAGGAIDVTGAVAAVNTLTADGNIDAGSLAGSDMLTSAQGDITVDGTVNGGSNTLSAVTGDITVGSVAATTEDAKNVLTAQQGTVTIKSLVDGGDYTEVLAKNIVIGEDGGTALTAEHQTWDGVNLTIAGAGLELVDSHLSLTGTISGTSLTLTNSGTATLSYSAQNVALDSLTLNSNNSLTLTGDAHVTDLTINDKASMTVDGYATIETLTLNGDSAIFQATGSTITSLILQNGAHYDGVIATVTGVTFENGGTVTVEALDGITNLKVGSNTFVYVTGNQGLTQLEEDLHVTGESLLAVSGSLATDKNILASGSSSISGADITADGSLTANGGSISSTTGGITAGTGVSATDGTISSAGAITATTGNVTASTGGSITAAGAISATAGSVTANGGSISSTTGGITAGTGVSATNGTISSEAAITATTGDVTASAGGTITAAGAITATTGSVATTGGTIEAAGIASGADVAAEGGSISSTSGDVTAAGAVSATDGGSISVTGGGITTGTPALDADPAIDGSITAEGGSITATGAITATTGDVTADAGSIAAGDALEIAEGDLTLSNKGSVSAQNGITLEKGSVTATDGSINGDLTLNGEGVSVSLTGTTVDGSVSFTDANAGVQMDNSLVTGDITGANSLLITNSSEVLGDVTLAGDGVLTISQSVIHGTVSGVNEVGIVDTVVTESVTSGKDLTIIGGEVQGMITITDPAAPDQTPGSVTLVNTTVGTSNGLDLSDPDHPVVTPSTGLSVDGAYSLDASGTTLKGGVALEGGEATLSATSVGADKDGNSLTGASSLEATKGTSLAGDVTLVQDAAGNATASLDASAVQGSITGATALDAAKGSTVGGDVTLVQDADGNALASVDASKVQGSITGATEAAITGGSVTGAIVDAGTVTVADSTTGDISATGDVELTKASTGAVTTVGGDVTVTGAVLADSVSGLGLTVNKYGSLTAETGDVSADGVITIAGELTAQKGSIVLDGDATSAITADVAAEQNVTLKGGIAASGTEAKPIEIAASAGDVTLDGSLDTAYVAISGDDIAVNGTLNAGAGTVLAGTVSGAGTINKTGGDELVLAADTNMAGGTVNVSDGSTLKAEGGHLGAITVAEGSTLVVGGDSSVATELLTDSLTMDAGSKLQATLNLAAAKADKVTSAGNVDLKGATLVLDSTVAAEEAAIADGTRHTVVGCTVLSGLNEDVEHSMETLNAHVENFGDHVDVVLSKNYKGAAKTPNQKQVAAALQTINPSEVEGSTMGDVLDALAHTRSESDAKAALDTLGGAGLAAIQKVIAEESREHMQTLRQTLTGLNQGIARRIAEDGSVLPGINSSAVAASITGGTSNVSGDGNVRDYSRSSMGFILTGVHAVNRNWSFGGGFAWSSSTASCGSVDTDSDAFYFDAAVMYNKGRLHQTGTVGVGFYGFDTDRNLAVIAAGHDYAGRANGSTSATAVNLSYEVSYDLIISRDGHHTFSPVGVAEATFAQVKDLKESGVGNAGLNSRFDDVQSLTVGGGARYTYSFEHGGERGFVSAEALVLGSAGDDTMMVRNNFIAGGTAFEMAGPKAGGVGLRLNVNALVPIDDQWAIIGNVASEFRSDQSAVSGSLGVKYSF